MWQRRRYRNLPNGRADVVVKMILDKSAHDAGFPNPGILEKNKDIAMKTKGISSDLV